MDGCIHRFPVPPHPPGNRVARISQQPEETDLPHLPPTHLQSFPRSNHGAEYSPDQTTVGHNWPIPRTKTPRTSTAPA